MTNKIKVEDRVNYTRVTHGKQRLKDYAH